MQENNNLAWYNPNLISKKAKHACTQLFLSFTSSKGNFTCPTPPLSLYHIFFPWIFSILLFLAFPYFHCFPFFSLNFLQALKSREYIRIRLYNPSPPDTELYRPLFLCLNPLCAEISFVSKFAAGGLCIINVSFTLQPE